MFTASCLHMCLTQIFATFPPCHICGDIESILPRKIAYPRVVTDNKAKDMPFQSSLGLNFLRDNQLCVPLQSSYVMGMVSFA